MLNILTNAAFIVRAVNCHEELVEALSRVIDNRDTGSYESTEQSIREARAVLAKARGETK